MGFFDNDNDYERAHEEYQSTKHEANVSHEVMAGGAAFWAMREFEKRQEKNGKPASHPHAKELIAGLVGAFIDREMESRGRDAFDHEKAKHEAKKRAQQAYERHYEGN